MNNLRGTRRRVASAALAKAIHRVVRAQVVVTLAVAGGVFLYRGGHGVWSEGGFEALSALYGGAVTTLSTLWMGWRIRVTGSLAIGSPDRGKWALYAGVAQRFGFVVIALALGMGALELSPLPLLAAFTAAHVAYTLVASRC